MGIKRNLQATLKRRAKAIAEARRKAYRTYLGLDGWDKRQVIRQLPLDENGNFEIPEK